jgi:hypothetical protein
MLVLSVLTSVLLAGVLGLVLYLFIGGYSGGNSPTSVTPVLFPIALLIFVVVGLPSMLLCGAMWAGYSLSTRRRRLAGGDAPAAQAPGSDRDSAIVAWPGLVASRTGALAG